MTEIELQERPRAEAAPPPRRRTTAGEGYARASQAIANLRGVFILILLSFHACLAYLGSTKESTAPFDAPPYPWLAFPVVDERRFLGFDLYCAWVDVHLMAMMFFLSGLFLAPSLKRKGAGRFAADRLMRLGLPFLFGVFVLSPVAVYPAFHRLEPGAGFADYLAAYRALPFLPNGPCGFSGCCLRSRWSLRPFMRCRRASSRRWRRWPPAPAAARPAFCSRSAPRRSSAICR